MNIEHVKAHLNKVRIWPRQNGKSDQYESLQLLGLAVAAVERVQALHEPLKLFLLDDNGSIDYSKPFDTLCRGCTDPDIVNAWECDDGDPGDDYVQHPCPTIEALETP